MMKKIYVVVIILSLLALWPFFKKGYFETHDGLWMMIRSSAFHQALSTGQFPVRFVDRLNNNYGYPVMNYIYPLPFYLLEIPKIIGFSYETNYKSVFLFSSIMSSTLMFWALSQKFSKYASLAGSIIYLYTPYRFLDIYVRGSVGESVAFAAIPLAFGCLLKIEKDSKIFLPIFSFSIAILILSHNVIAAFFVPLFAALGLLLVKHNKSEVLIATVAGILLSVYFWFPAIYDLKYVNVQRIETPNIANHLVPLSSLINPSWGFGPMPNTPNGISVQLGVVSLTLVIIAIILRLKRRSPNRLIDLLILSFVTSAFLITTVSIFFWEKMPYVNIVQFPWRLLSVTTFATAGITAYIVDSTNRKKLITTLIVAASILLTIQYTVPKAFYSYSDGFYSTNEDPTAIRDEYQPLWVEKKPSNRANQKLQLISGGEILNQQIKPNYYKALISSATDTILRVNTIYFPGHNATIDGKKVLIDFKNKSGLIELSLPKGKHEVIIKYGRTPVHLVSEIISLLALIGTGSYLFYIWRIKNT